MADELGALAAVASDPHMQARVAAALAQQHGAGFTVPDPTQAEQEAWAKRWDWAATPTFAERYKYAVDSGNPNPGGDPAVIPDLDIIAWVQAEYPKPAAPPELHD